MGWSGGPFELSNDGLSEVKGQKLRVNPAFRFDPQKAGKLRAVDGLNRRFTNEASREHALINPPSWHHVPQMCSFYSLYGDNWPPAMKKADHADAYKRHPLLKREQLSAAETLRRPTPDARYGFPPKIQIFGSTAAVLHYNCLSRELASLPFGFLRNPVAQ